MAMNVAAFADNLDPIFRKIWHDEDEAWPTVTEQIFNVSTTNLYQVKESANSGFSTVPQKTHGQASTLDYRYQLYDKTYTQVSYGMGTEVDREMMDFDTSSSMEQIPRAMQFSTKATIETVGANVFNRHINSSYTGPDAKVLCANDHPARPGSSATHDNLGTTGSLTHTTLADGRLNMRKTKNPRQIPMVLTPRKLLVPPDLEEKARIITQSDRKSGSANWDVNIFKNAGLDIVVNPYITVTTAYWLLTDKRQHQLTLIWSAKPEFNRDKGVSEQIAKWFVYMRFVLGWTDWRGIWGNNGA